MRLHLRWREPLLIPALGLIAGIVVCERWPLGVRPLAVAAGVLSLLLTLAAWKAKRLVPLVLCLLLAAAGATRYASDRKSTIPVIDAEAGEIVVLGGCVVDPPVLHSPGDRTRFLLELERGAIAQVSLYLREGDEPPVLHYGERIEFEGRVRAIRNFGNPGAFDSVRYFARRNVYWNVTARTDTKVVRTGGRCGNRLQAAIFRLRGAMEERIERLYPGDNYVSAMMAAILIGQTTGLERTWTDEFRRTGTYHALVVSGMHFTSLAFLMLLGLRLIAAGPKTRLVAGLFMGWLYTALCGWSAPVVRAAGAFTLILIAQWMFRRVRLLNGLAAVAIAYLLWDPGQLFEASFQLSFAAVAALGALAEPLLNHSTIPYSNSLRLITKKGRDFRLSPKAAEFRVELRLLAETFSLWTRIPQVWCENAAAFAWRTIFFLWELLSISFVMQVALTIPMAIYFHRVTWTGLTANLVVVPLMTIAVPSGLAAIATGWSMPASIARWCLETSSRVALWHVQAADLHFERRISDAPVWAFALTAGALIVAALSFRTGAVVQRWRWPACAAAFAVSMWLVFTDFAPRFRPGILEISMVDVGQGDCILIAFPDGKRMLIDGGGFLSFGGGGSSRKPRIDTGEDVVSPYLWLRRLQRVDIIASTHAHDDHIGGLPALIENFRPREVWTGAVPTQQPPDGTWRRVQTVAARFGIPIVRQNARQPFSFGRAQVEVLAPVSDYESSPGTPRNNDSLVLLVQYGQRRFLFTGDAEKQLEGQLAANASDRAQLLPPVDVLKAAHHGSRTSSTPFFLDTFRPRLALISVGYENQFRHPHPNVLRAFTERGIQVLRTDRHGLIQIRTDGRSLEVHTPSTVPDNDF